MKLTIRRIGNSLGVIIPRAQLAAWGVTEGGQMEVTDGGIRPLRKASAHEALDELKLALARAVVDRYPPARIRAQIAANLHRWKARGSWVSAYDEWKAIAGSGDDGALFAAMLGRDERSQRLRQSMPFVGLLPRDVVRRLNEEAAG